MDREKVCPKCGQPMVEYTKGAFGATEYVVFCVNPSCGCKCSHGGGFEFAWKLMDKLAESEKSP